MADVILKSKTTQSPVEKMSNGDNESALATYTGGASAFSRCTVTQSTTYAHGGTKSAKMSPNGTSGADMAWMFNYRNDGTQVVPLHVYLLTCWVYIPDTVPAGTCTRLIAKIGSSASDQYGALASRDVPAHVNTWTQLRLWVTTPDTVETADWSNIFLVRVYCDTTNAANILYFDDISIVQQMVTGMVIGSVPTLAATGKPGKYGSISAAMPALTASVNALRGIGGSINCSMPAVGAAISGSRGRGGYIRCGLPAVSAQVSGRTGHKGSILAPLPGLTARVRGYSGTRYQCIQEEDD